MTTLDYGEIRRLLEHERDELLKDIMEAGGPPRHMNPDRDDLAQDFVALEQNSALKALEREQLEQIDNALQRLDDGTYGICTNCGAPIPVERLRILPYATLCVRCQAEQEKRW